MLETLHLRGPRNLHPSRTATPFRRDAPDALRHPAQATGTAGRLCSGDAATILSDLGRHRSQPTGSGSKPGRGDRGGRRRGEEADGHRAAWSRGHPGSGPDKPPQAPEEIPRSALPRREPSHAPLLLRGFLLVRGRLPHSGREAAARRSRPTLPPRELPAGAALRRRVGHDRRGRSLIRSLAIRPSPTEGKEKVYPGGRFGVNFTNPLSYVVATRDLSTSPRLLPGDLTSRKATRRGAIFSRDVALGGEREMNAYPLTWHLFSP